MDREDVIWEVVRRRENQFEEHDPGPESIEELLDERDAYRKVLRELQESAVWGINTLEVEQKAREVLDRFDTQEIKETK